MEKLEILNSLFIPKKQKPSKLYRALKFILIISVIAMVFGVAIGANISTLIFPVGALFFNLMRIRGGRSNGIFIRVPCTISLDKDAITIEHFRVDRGDKMGVHDEKTIIPYNDIKALQYDKYGMILRIVGDITVTKTVNTRNGDTRFVDSKESSMDLYVIDMEDDELREEFIRTLPEISNITLNKAVF